MCVFHSARFVRGHRPNKPIEPQSKPGRHTPLSVFPLAVWLLPSEEDVSRQDSSVPAGSSPSAHCCSVGHHHEITDGHCRSPPPLPQSTKTDENHTSIKLAPGQLLQPGLEFHFLFPIPNYIQPRSP